MGVFGFFIFLSVLVMSGNWRSVKINQLRRDMLVQLLASGQQLDSGQLAQLLGLQSQRIPAAQWKIGILLLLGAGSIVLSFLYWDRGMLPVLVAGLVGLSVAYATWRHEHKVVEISAALSVQRGVGQ